MADAGPAKVPPTFKALVPFIRRAEELDRDSSRPESKLIAYFCRQYAMELGIKLREHDASNEATDFLLGLMDRLEAEKDKLPEFSQEEGKEICEDFAMEIFSKADDEDRAGLADKNTAKTFYAAGTFFDILNQFGDISDDVAEKRKYCKYKAATILKALKEGQVPTPGPPDGDMGDFKGTTGEPPSPVYSAPPVPPAAPSAPPSAPESSPAVDFPSFTGSVGSVNGPGQYSTPSFQGYQQQQQPQQQYQPPPQAPSAPVAPPTPMAPIPPPVATPQTIPSRSHGSPVSQNEVDDAIECAKFAIAALKIKDIDLAVQRLEMALRSIK